VAKPKVTLLDGLTMDTGGAKFTLVMACKNVSHNVIVTKTLNIYYP